MRLKNRPVPQHMRLKIQPLGLVTATEIEELDALAHRVQFKADLAKLAPQPNIGEALDLAMAAKRIRARAEEARLMKQIGVVRS